MQNRQNYSSGYRDIYIFGNQTGKQESLLRIMAKILLLHLFINEKKQNCTPVTVL
jgi:hypothetical protein